MRRSRWARHRFKQITAATAGLLITATAVSVAGAEPSADDGPRATIRYTEYGIPHILARDFDGLGYGYGYAAAKDNICVIADMYVTVNAQRSRFLGPEGEPSSALSSASDNLASDVHFQRIIDSGIVRELVSKPAPQGPRQEVREIVTGYVDGYNRYLAEVGPSGVTDPACQDAPWLRPITEIDFYRHFYALATLGGTGALVDGLVDAGPAAQPAAAPADPNGTATRMDNGLSQVLRTGDLGSNGIAIGRDGVAKSAKAKSVLLGNPHYPWHDGRRFWQTQLTIPGKMNVSGASLLGVPLVQIGYTSRAAWTHTVATPRTFGLYELDLVDGDPTRYLVDGVGEKMTSTTVQVKVKQPDGSLRDVSKTLYSSRYGPILDSVAGVPLPWTDETAYAVRDANRTNLRGLNTWFLLDNAHSTKQIVRALSTTQGIPWVNTIATDKRGRALYADIQVVPHITDELEQRCGTALGHALFERSRVAILDGSRSECRWGTDAKAVEPGIFAPDQLPQLERNDYALNTNDSAWLANTRQPITDYPRIVGDIGTDRGMRTREALVTVEEQLAAGGFTKQSMQDMLFTDRSRFAVMAADDTAVMCAAFPNGMAPSSNGPVEVGSACEALAAWDHTYKLDSKGSLLFERFVRKLRDGEDPWAVPFDLADPVHTPNTLRTGHPDVQTAFGDAAAELQAAGIPLDARLVDHQYVVRNGERIPLHGSRGDLGVLNVVTPVWDPEAGNTEIVSGSSYIQVVAFGNGKCPDVATLLTYSQSANPNSPHHTDQTKLYSQGEWVTGRFCEGDIRTAPDLRVVHLD